MRADLKKVRIETRTTSLWADGHDPHTQVWLQVAPGIAVLTAEEAIAVGEHLIGSGTALRTTGRAP